MMVAAIFHLEDIMLNKGIEDQLKWYKRHPKCPTTPDDRAVRKLVYGEFETDMGHVCETANGKFLAFTMCQDIACMPASEYLIQYNTAEEAGNALFAYVVKAVYDLIIQESTMPFEVTRTFKKRDRLALDAYMDSGSIQCETSAFKCGMDWILRSEGFPRRPSWAKFLVQNRDGQLFWFECKPVVNYSTGIWSATDGKMQPVAFDQWSSKITRLT